MNAHSSSVFVTEIARRQFTHSRARFLWQSEIRNLKFKIGNAPLAHLAEQLILNAPFLGEDYPRYRIRYRFCRRRPYCWPRLLTELTEWLPCFWQKTRSAKITIP
jgi:hypothetical protein